MNIVATLYAQSKLVRLHLRKLLLLQLVLASINVAGHCSISVMPMEVQLKAPVPGNRISNDIEVFNPGDVTLHITASIMDWELTEKGDARFAAPGTLPRSCAPWIQMNPMSFSVSPKNSVRVRYSVTPPLAITEEHWAMIFFQTRAVPLKSSRIGINISTRVGCKVFVAPTQSVPPQGKIVDMSVQAVTESEIKTAAALASRIHMANSTKTTPANSLIPSEKKNEVQALPDISNPTTKVKVVFENTGLTNLRVQGSVEARDAQGKLLAQGILLPKRAQIFSGAKRELWAQLDKPLAPGMYQFKAIIDYGVKELVSGELKAKVTTPVTTSSGSSAPSVAVTSAVPEKLRAAGNVDLNKQ